MPGKKKRIEELERRIEEPGFWDLPEESKKIMQKLKGLQGFVERIEGLENSYEDIGMLIEISEEEEEEGMIGELQSELDSFKTDFEELRIQTLLSGKYDGNNAIVTLHAGAGGTESCDWAGMLYRMYSRWAEKKGFAMEVLDFLDGDVACMKTVTFEVEGENAYGYLKSEK